MTKSQPRLLAIDDDQASLYILAKALAPDYELVTTTEWLDGINLVMSEHFDGIILDLRMPMFDPQVLVKKLREDKPQLSIIVLSAYEDAIQRLSGAPVDAIISKSIPDDQLKRTVAKALEPR